MDGAWARAQALGSVRLPVWFQVSSYVTLALVLNLYEEIISEIWVIKPSTQVVVRIDIIMIYIIDNKYYRLVLFFACPFAVS